MFFILHAIVVIVSLPWGGNIIGLLANCLSGRATAVGALLVTD